MLTRLYADNVRCLVNFEFRPGKLSLLLGPNGGGKSTILEVLSAVRALARGGTEVASAFPRHERTRWDTRGTQRVELEVAGPGGTYKYVLEVEHDDRAVPPSTIIRSESVEIDGTSLFRFADSKVVLYKNTGETGPTFPHSPRRSFLASLEPSPANTLLIWFLQWLDRVWLFKLDPTRLRESWIADREVRWLSGNGDNLAAFYRHLAQEMPDVSTRICDDLTGAFKGIQQILLRSLGESRGLVIRFAPPGVEAHELPFSAVSDGQAMLLALYVLLHAVADRATLLCIDEPDNFVALPEIQPWLVRLGDAVESGEAQALLISHSPEVIDYLASDSAFLVERPDGTLSRVAPLAIDRTPGMKASRSSLHVGGRRSMRDERVRIVLLCEDRMQERLLRPHCQRRWGTTPRVSIAPAGKGSAEAWVRSQYPSEVRLLRAKGQENVGLVVVTDGDKVGVAARKAALDDVRRAAGLGDRSGAERVAIVVPTWSIETWIRALGGEGGLVETTSYKSAQPIDGAGIRMAASCWPGDPPGCGLPAMVDALAELSRIDP